jgi:UDP-glucose 4-epimerase
VITPGTKRRLLVTGASGFVGRHVLGRLAGRGYEIVALVGQRALPESLAARCTRVVRADITDDDALRAALRHVDVVCHLAARIPSDHEDPAEAEPCLRVNALGTLRLAQFSVSAGVRRFVHVSTGNLYAPVDHLAREGDAVFPSRRAAYYLSSKLLGELYVEHLRQLVGLPAVTLRLSNVYGPEMRASSVVSRFVDRALAGDPLEVNHGGRPSVDHVYVSDVAWCIESALASGEPGIYNVGAGHAWSLLELAEVVIDVFGSDSPIVVRPPDGQAPASFAPLSIDKAKATWGYNPLSLRDGLGRLRACRDQLSTPEAVP